MTKDPNPTKTGQGVADGQDSFRQLQAAIGSQGMRNQEDLNAFKTWLIEQPHVTESGFYESAVDLSRRTMTLLWHGASPLQAQAIAEGARRGLTIVIRPVPYTRASVDHAMAALLDPANQAKLGGVQVTSVAGPTLDTDKLTINTRSRPQTVERAGDVITQAGVSVAAAAKALTGLDAIVAVGGESVPYTMRSTDTSPFKCIQCPGDEGL